MTIFAISDVHSFFTPMKKALDEAGFEPWNLEHLLVVCGDIMDRGDESQKMLDYLMLVPNKVLIKGNHESLLQDMCSRKYPYTYDFSNGTHKTVCDLAPNAKEFVTACSVTIEKMSPLLNQMVDYFETKHYIFCHGYLPTHKNPKKGFYELDPDWRYAHASDWEDARWLNGMKMAMDGCDPGKCVVVGHFHTSWGHAIQDRTFDEWGEEADFSPFYYENKLIAIDACTAHTGKVNILKIENEELL